MTAKTAPADLVLLAGATRVHAVESASLARMREARVFAYRLPEDSFARDPEVGGYWLSRERVVPLDVSELGDLVVLHARAGIELRSVANLWSLWDRPTSSTLEFSGIRLYKAAPRAR